MLKSAYLQRVYNDVVTRDPDQREFHQAVLDAYQQSLTQIPQQRQPGMGQEEAPPAPEMKM